jgi:hypothetical protein
MIGRSPECGLKEAQKATKVRSGIGEDIDPLQDDCLIRCERPAYKVVSLRKAR